MYYRGFFDASTVTGRISGNVISAYQKGGIVSTARSVRSSDEPAYFGRNAQPCR